jgi:sec-independent protein translocase protein TatA
LALPRKGILMPFGIGPLELVIFLVILLVIFGPKRLPAAGRALGQGMREFKDSVTGKDKGDEDQEDRELPAAAAPPPPAPARPAGTEDASRAFGRDE